MEPLKTYTQKQFGNVREFKLYPDKIFISGKKFLGDRFEASIPLNAINPEFGRTWMRSQAWSLGLIIFVGFATATRFFSKAIWPEERWIICVLAMLSVFGLILTITTFRPIEFASFRNKNGLVAFDFGLVGKDRVFFDAFLEAVVKQIKECERKK